MISTNIRYMFLIFTYSSLAYTCKDIVQEKLATKKDSEDSYRLKAKRFLYKRVHILQWLPNYTKNDVLADFISGLTVGLTMMPQSIAYAGLAGIAPQYGLYTAFIGSLTYICFGTIREVSIGPTSLMALLTASYTIGKPIECVILLTLIAGFVELMMAVLKLGFLVDFISPSLSSGFTSATAIIIVAAQLKNVFGLSIHSHDTIGIMKEFLQKYKEIRWPDTIMALSCFVLLMCFKLLLPKIKIQNGPAKKTIKFIVMAKNAITVLLASLVAAYYHYYKGGAPFKLTGKVPQGLPALSFPALTTKFGNETVGYQEMVSSLSSGVIVVPVVAVLANVAIAKAYSQDVVVDASQEMISLGLCNIFGSFVQAMPSCGAFTRSAVASSSDVRTPLQGLYSGSLILLALSFLAPYFFFIPKATLAAVLITAAGTLLDYEIFPVLWRCNKVDYFLTMSTFILGALFGVETALVIGAICNILVLLKVWSRPKIHVDIQSIKDSDQQYLYIKPELGLYYVGCDYFSEFIKKTHKDNTHLSIIVVDCAHILRLDYSGARTLAALLKTFNGNGVLLTLINVSPDILAVLKTVTDTYILSFCESTDQININLLNNKLEEAKPLLSSAARTRRKSSVKSSIIRIEDRKLSIS